MGLASAPPGVGPGYHRSPPQGSLRRVGRRRNAFLPRTCLVAEDRCFRGSSVQQLRRQRLRLGERPEDRLDRWRYTIPSLARGALHRHPDLPLLRSCGPVPQGPVDPEDAAHVETGGVRPHSRSRRAPRGEKDRSAVCPRPFRLASAAPFPAGRTSVTESRTTPASAAGTDGPSSPDGQLLDGRAAPPVRYWIGERLGRSPEHAASQAQGVRPRRGLLAPTSDLSRTTFEALRRTRPERGERRPSTPRRPRSADVRRPMRELGTATARHHILGIASRSARGGRRSPNVSHRILSGRGRKGFSRRNEHRDQAAPLTP
jgi:hypothetical protein